jgi:hypothetical protein
MIEVASCLRVVRSSGAVAGNSVMSERDTPKGESSSPCERRTTAQITGFRYTGATR